MNEDGGGDALANTNRYCVRAGLESTPRVEEAVGQPGVNLFHLMVVALLEHGGPMPIAAIARRLVVAGAVAPSGDMMLSLTKAWHGRDPIVRDPDGRLALDLSSRELSYVVWQARLQPRRAAPPPEPPEPDLPGDDVPLADWELTAAFRGRPITSVSGQRQAAAVLDVAGQPRSPAEVEAVLATLTQYRHPLSSGRVGYWRSGLVTLDGTGRLSLDRTSPQLGAMRRAVRRLARSVLLRQAREDQMRTVIEEQAATGVEQARGQAEEAALLRRALVRAVPDAAAPRAIAILDLQDRSFRILVGSEIESVDVELAGYDVLIGLHVRDSLLRLGLDADRWRIIDLKPPQKNRRVGRARTLAITPELLIASTTGISRPLGQPTKVAAHLTAGARHKLDRRLESDLKALYAFYEYGALQNSIRLRWGFLDEMIPVDWALPGQPHVHALLRTALESGTPVEVVWGVAPDWAEPWSRARRGHVLGLAPWEVTLRLDDGVWRLDRREIQAVRHADDATVH